MVTHSPATARGLKILVAGCEQYFDAFQLAAKYRGISLAQFFKQEPERYKQYCRLVLEE